MAGNPTWTKGQSGNPASQWKPGQSGNPAGRARREVEVEYLAAISEACPREKWLQIVARAVADAVNGDGKARDWLAGYLVGKAPDTIPDSDPRPLLTLVAPDESASVEAWLKDIGKDGPTGPEGH